MAPMDVKLMTYKIKYGYLLLESTNRQTVDGHKKFRLPRNNVFRMESSTRKVQLTRYLKEDTILHQGFCFPCKNYLKHCDRTTGFRKTKRMQNPSYQSHYEKQWKNWGKTPTRKS